MPDNRRVRMTKTMMKSALLELLENKPLEKITVTDVCGLADVNRSTFYAYYGDVGMLLTEIEDDVLGQLPVPPDADLSGEGFIDLLEGFFDYVRNNERLFRILLVRRDSGSFNRKLVNTVMEKYRSPLDRSDELTDRYGYIYCVNGVIGILKEWINSDFPISSRSFAEIVLHMSSKVTE